MSKIINEVCGKHLDNLASLYGIKRKSKEPDEHFRKRILSFVKEQNRKAYIDMWKGGGVNE